MKKLLSLAAVFFIASLPVLADIIYPDGHKPTASSEPFYIKKLGRGINNILTSPVEVPKAALDMSYEYGPWDFTPWTLGLFVRGPYKMFKRLGSGICDLVTFNSNTVPSKRMHLEPEFLNVIDVVPGGPEQFSWETLDTPSYRLETAPDR